MSIILNLKRGNQDLGTGVYTIEGVKDLIKNDNLYEMKAANKLKLLNNSKVKYVQSEICDMEFALFFKTDANVSYIASSILDRMFDMYLKEHKGQWTKDDTEKVLKYVRNFCTKIEKKYASDTLAVEALIKILFYNVNINFNKLFGTQLLEYEEFPFEEDTSEYTEREDIKKPVINMEMAKKSEIFEKSAVYDPWQHI